MAKQKMIQNNDTVEMIPSDIVSVKSSGKKAKVNMVLPTGGVLTKGEDHDLTADDIQHLQKSFGSELSHILE